MTIGGRWLSVSVAAACFTMPAPAQTPFVSGGASVVGIHSQGVTSGVATRTSGTRLGGVATARCGEAGVTLQTSDRPWWFRVSYGIDRSAVAGASRRETVEEFTLTVGIRRR